MDWADIFSRIAEICRDPGYSTIIGAIIAAVAAIIAAVYQTKKGKGHQKPPPIEIPPDRTAPLQTDPFRLKEIDEVPFNSQEYSDKSALLYEMTKGPDTVAEVLHDEGDGKDEPHHR